MAPPRSRNAPTKKHALTLAQIASYDDILTDALVDHAFYWTTIPKNRPSYLPSRGIKEEEIGQIIQAHLVVTPDLQAAEEKLLATNGLKRFYNALKTDAEKEDFRRHLRRYMQIYLPDCPFEVAATNRYTIFQEEACISARRFIKCHETIKYLSGIQVVITAEEEAQLSARKKDFSIVVSSRKKEVNLFMGPARFANHDCDANARLVTTGQAGIEIIATKSIGVGDEITVTYGDSYFGEDNCECLCKTCEDNLVNGWAPADGSLVVKQSIEYRTETGTPVRGYSLRRRDDSSYNRSHSETPSLGPIARPKVFRASLRKLVRATPADGTPAAEDPRSQSGVPASPLAMARSPSRPESRGLKRGIDTLLTTPPVTPAKKAKITGAGTGAVTVARRGAGCYGSAGAAPVQLAGQTTVLPVLSPTPKRLSVSGTVKVLQHGLDETVVPMPDQMPTPESTHEPTDSDAGDEACTAGEGPSARQMEDAQSTIVVRPLPTPEFSADSGEDDEVDIVATDPEPTAAAPSPPRRGRPRKRLAETTEFGDLPSLSSRTNKRGKRDVSEPGVHEQQNANDGNEVSEPKRQRVPGDYTLTPLLLSEPETAWVVCMVCNKAFVQRNAYFTRMSCPRCERHSKLYGYIWPKTEPEGKADKEERILDHRLVHRFLHAEDEAKIRGRKWPAAWRRETTADGDEGGQQGRGGRSGRRGASAFGTETTTGKGSGVWRKLRYTVDKEQADSAQARRTKTKPIKSASLAKRTTVTVNAAPKTTTAKVAKAAKATKTTKPKLTLAAKLAQRPRPARVVRTKKAFGGSRASGRPRRASAKAGDV